MDRAMKKSRSQEEIAMIDRLKKRITILLQTMGEDSLIKEMTPFMTKNANNILERNEKFFIDMNARDEYIAANGKEPTPEDEYLLKLVESIKTLYQKIPKREQDEVYADIVKLFNCCIEYEML
jgi:hypothetical protein